MTLTTQAHVPVITSDSRKLTRTMKAKLDNLRVIRANAAALKAEADALTAELLDFAGEAHTLTWGTSTLAKVVDSKNVRNDAKVLAEAYPEAYAASLVVKPYKQIR